MATPDFIVGILGNVISVLLCASPMGLFWELTKTKSAENYNALPYISQLLCKSLWTFYGILEPNGLLIVTVNSVGVVSQVMYVFIYLIYAPTDKKVKALVFVAILNIAFPGSVIVATLLAFHGSARRTFIGIFCAAVTVAMYAAPLSVMRTVIKTKSVKYMPFFLSLFLLLNAGCWFTFALLLKDHYVIVANAIGIVTGSAQLIIYMIYKDKSSLVESEKTKVKEASIHKLEEGIKAQDMNEFDEGKLKSRSASLPKPSISRAYTINKLMRTVSMSQYESHSAFLLVP